MTVFPTAPKILVIAPDDALRQSLVFVLASLGTAPVASPVVPREVGLGGFRCVIIDEAALEKAAVGIRTLERLDVPVILTTSGPEHRAVPQGWTVVRTPFMHSGLIDAVNAALANEVFVNAIRGVIPTDGEQG